LPRLLLFGGLLHTTQKLQAYVMLTRQMNLVRSAETEPHTELFYVITFRWFYT